MAPEFFIHKWRKNAEHQVDLLIEVSQDFETVVLERIAKKNQEGTSKVDLVDPQWRPLRTALSNQMLRDRCRIFKLRLLEEVQRAHDQMLKECLNSSDPKLTLKAQNYI